MAAARSTRARLLLRAEREETSRIAWALVVSLCIHLLLFGTYQAGKKYDLWDTTKWPKWLQPPRLLSEVLKKSAQPKPKPAEEQVPLMFVEVNPAVATPEPPKDTPFYAAHNSKAADPDPQDDAALPKIDGKQEVVVKTEDVKPEPVTKLQPAIPPPQPEPQPPQPEVKPQPEPVRPPGDLAMSKPQLEPQVKPVEPKPSRPKTVREARARQDANRIPGEKMRQEGGAPRGQIVPSFDAKATPFGTYDQMLVEAISQRWFSLLEQREYASDGRGKVVLQFILHYNGRVTDVQVTENSAGEVLGLICQKAVMDPAPYSQWPGDMRRMMGDTRKIQFAFYFN